MSDEKTFAVVRQMIRQILRCEFRIPRSTSDDILKETIGAPFSLTDFVLYDGNMVIPCIYDSFVQGGVFEIRPPGSALPNIDNNRVIRPGPVNENRSAFAFAFFTSILAIVFGTILWKAITLFNHYLSSNNVEILDPVPIITLNQNWIYQHSLPAYNAVMDAFATNGLQIGTEIRTLIALFTSQITRNSTSYATIFTILSPCLLCSFFPPNSTP
ncbi:14395_t:CDS:2 [Acaulospora morrowiae]|uniref:14395_t:CDS:1 n=1 Tax=Acaulospora morrowiae TaxID=94023 RepID=A0A9N8VHB3_9GLOM|nr:14395_t:CDS:2 [Acaulospora morrowiae]